MTSYYQAAVKAVFFIIDWLWIFIDYLGDGLLFLW